MSPAGSGASPRALRGQWPGSPTAGPRWRLGPSIRMLGGTRTGRQRPASTTYPPGTPSVSTHVACHSDSIPVLLAAKPSHDASSAPTSGAIRQIGSYTPIRSPHPGHSGGSRIARCIRKTSSASPRASSVRPPFGRCQITVETLRLPGESGNPVPRAVWHSRLHGGCCSPGAPTHCSSRLRGVWPRALSR
jgi:hypothetical protein